MTGQGLVICKVTVAEYRVRRLKEHCFLQIGVRHAHTADLKCLR